MFLKIKFLLLFFFLISCQPIEVISPVEFDNSKLETISINAKDVIINVKYNSIFSEENIEDQINNTPLNILKNWIDDNIRPFGNQNKFIINILDASILKKEIENIGSKNYEEKTIFQFEVFYLVEYELLDDNDYLLGNTTVESFRTTTSKKYISLNENEIIINELLNKALKEFIKESKSMTKLYLGEYIN